MLLAELIPDAKSLSRADKLRLKNVKVNGKKLVPTRNAGSVAAFVYPGDEQYARAL